MLQPKLIAGLLVGAVALAFLLSVTDLKTVGTALASFPPILLPVLFGLVVVREAIRVAEWRYLLSELGLCSLWRHDVLALLAGDASQILPAGIYFENYLLQREERGAAVTTSLAATLAMQLLEAAVSLLVLCIVGVPGWAWLRPLAIAVMAGYAAFLILVSRPGVARWLQHHPGRSKLRGWLSVQLASFLESIGGLLRPRVLLRAGAMSASYLAFTVAMFYVIVRAYGVQGIGLPQAAAIYLFVLAIVVLNPLPSDLGVSELSGVGILTAFHVPTAEGLTIMLIARFALLLSSELLAGLAALVLHRELRHLSLGPDAREQAVACRHRWTEPSGRSVSAVPSAR